MSAISSFKSIENKHDVCRSKKCTWRNFYSHRNGSHFLINKISEKYISFSVIIEKQMGKKLQNHIL